MGRSASENGLAHHGCAGGGVPCSGCFYLLRQPAGLVPAKPRSEIVFLFARVHKSLRVTPIPSYEYSENSLVRCGLLPAVAYQRWVGTSLTGNRGLVGMVVAPLLVTALLTACAEQPTSSPVETTHAEPSNKYWVTSDRLNRHTCPSTDCGIVGQLFFREGTDVFEDKDGWARVSQYYDASCANGRSEYVDSGDSRCDPENGIVDGKFAEWVEADFLSENRPPDPAADATGVEALISGSDDFQKYRTAFAEAAGSLIVSGQCRAEDFREIGGWVKSTLTYRDQPIYFTYCQNSRVRLYLNAETGEVFR